MWWNYGFGWFFPGLFFPIFFIGFWLLIVFLFWGSWHRWGHHRWHHHWVENKSAEDILADRFAHGEIDEEEYRKRLEVLRGQGRGS